MLVFGIDVPLIELILVFSFIIFIHLIEAIVVIMLQVKHLNKTKKVTLLLNKLTETVLAIKDKELAELDKIKR